MSVRVLDNRPHLVADSTLGSRIMSHRKNHSERRSLGDD